MEVLTHESQHISNYVTAIASRWELNDYAPCSLVLKTFRNETTDFPNLSGHIILHILKSPKRCHLGLSVCTSHPLIHTLHSCSFGTEAPTPLSTWPNPGHTSWVALTHPATDNLSLLWTSCFLFLAPLAFLASSLHSSHLIYIFSLKLESHVSEVRSFSACICASSIVHRTVVYT